MTRAERDRLIADQHLIITLADGVCVKAYEDAGAAFDDAKAEAATVRTQTEREAEHRFFATKAEAEAEIARLEGLEVTE